MASTDKMMPKPTSHRSITGSRSCSYSNVGVGWTLLRTLGAPLTVARCSSSPRRGHGGMAVGRLHAAVGRERSCHGLQERGACPERVPGARTFCRRFNSTTRGPTLSLSLIHI